MIPYFELDRLVAFVSETALLTTPIVSRAVPPSLEPLGNSLLLNVDGDLFLISAGHLLHMQLWAELLIPGRDNQMLWLNGKLVTTDNKANLKNKIDFAVLKFSERMKKHFEGAPYGFINPYRIIIDHKLKMDDSYVVAGYPINSIKKTAGKSEFHASSLQLLTYPIEERKYKRHGFEPRQHILVKYQRKLKPFRSNQTRITVEPRGISGSGLWFVPDWSKMVNQVPEFFLVGIMTENYKDFGFLVALRIDYIIEVIRCVFGKQTLPKGNLDIQNLLKNTFFGEMP